jgi:ubiquinone/menaquinone biosynthesis C-methylase UbiE
MQVVKNPFDARSVAQRYGKGRHYFHPLAIERIGKRLALKQKVGRALDVGCGTGFSSRALLKIAEQVDAIDASRWMLEAAFGHPRIRYRQMPAEKLDFPNSSFDLITMSQVVHWTNVAQPLQEAFRVLKPDSFVVIYDDYFLWGAEESAPFVRWFRAKFKKRFPQPPRNVLPLNARGEFTPEGFTFAGYEEYSHLESLTMDKLLEHLITQSTVICAVDQAGESLEDAVQWLQSQLREFYDSAAELTFPFGGYVYYLLRT